MNKKFKTLTLALAISTSSMAIQGCSDTDLALGTGVVIGAIIGSHASHGHHHHDRGHHRGHHRRYSVEFDLKALDTANNSTQIVADKYEISEQSAEILLLNLERIHNGETSALTDLGLTKNDLINIMNGKSISASALENMSLKLGMSSDETLDLLNEIKLDVKESLAKRSQPSIIPGH